MFLRAGFNPRHRRTGIRAFTARLGGVGAYAPAELIQFLPSREWAWYGEDRFVAWPECCAFRNVLVVGSRLRA